MEIARCGERGNSMSEKKKQSVAEPIAEPATENKSATKTKSDKTAEKKGGFCVYLGPTILGVIQSGTVFSQSKADVLKSISSVVEKYPLVASLIVTDKTLSEDRIKVKTPGNILNVNYRKMLKGKK